MRPRSALSCLLQGFGCRLLQGKGSWGVEDCFCGAPAEVFRISVRGRTSAVICTVPETTSNDLTPQKPPSPSVWFHELAQSFPKPCLEQYCQPVIIPKKSILVYKFIRLWICFVLSRPLHTLMAGCGFQLHGRECVAHLRDLWQEMRGQLVGKCFGFTVSGYCLGLGGSELIYTNPKPGVPCRAGQARNRPAPPKP